jgi:hypothetical protein
MQNADGWQAEARRMRSQGKTSDEIAVALHQGPSVVREVLRGTPRQPPTVFGAGAEPHVARVPRPILDEAALAAAAMAFAAGEIDRAELMRRISR